MNIARLLDIGTADHQHHCHVHHHANHLHHPLHHHQQCLLLHPLHSPPTQSHHHLLVPNSFSSSSASSSIASPSNGKENRQNKMVATPTMAPVTAAATTALSLTNSLKFGIENILQPEFGTTSSTSSMPSPRHGYHSQFHAHHRRHDKQQQQQHTFCSPPPRPQTAASIPLAQSAKCGDAPLPSWLFCTRYSDRPSAGPRTRKSKRRELTEEEKRPRTAFTLDQLERLRTQFRHNRYLTEKKRQELAYELGLNECQIKIWFQNKRAKLKKTEQRMQPPHGLLKQAAAQLFKRQ